MEITEDARGLRRGNSPFSAYSSSIDHDYFEQAVYPREYPGLVLVHEKPEVVRTHWHPGAEVVYVKQGRGSFIVDTEAHTLEPGLLLLISPYSVHQSVVEDFRAGQTRIVSVTFDDSRVKEAYPLARRYLLSLDAPGAGPEQRSRLVRLCEDLDEATGSGSPERALRINAILYEMLFLMYSSFVIGTRHAVEDRQGRNIIMPMVAYIEAHCVEPITAGDVATRFGYSREHFSRMFAMCTGLTFKSYLTLLRVELAYQLLMVGKRSLTDIARRSGFPSVRAMSAAFLHRYGDTPIAYRMSHANSGV